MGMKIFDGRVILGAEIIVACVGLVAMLSLSGKNRKLEPVSSVRGWLGALHIEVAFADA